MSAEHRTARDQVMDACRQVVAGTPLPGQSELHPEWRHNLLAIASDLLRKGPEGFLRIPTLRYTLSTGDYDDTPRQLAALRALPDWDTRWHPALVESEVGAAEPSYWLSDSSGNLIRQAYLLAKFEEEMGSAVTSFDQIIEFGGGFGAMCRLAHRLGFRGRYVLLEPQPIRALQRWYLQSDDENLPLAEDGALPNDGICTLPNNALSTVLEHSEGHHRTAFFALWSLSETLTSVRDQVFNTLRTGHVEAIWVVYQERCGISNGAYFASRIADFTNVYEVSLKPLQPQAAVDDYFYGHACLAFKKVPGRRFPPSPLETMEGFDAQEARYLPIDELFHRLRDAIASNTPFSAIRLGDGEGRIMGYPDYVLRFQVSEIWEYWFGHTRFSTKDVAELQAGLRAACQTADVIGVPQTMPNPACDFGRVRALLAHEGYCPPTTPLTHAGFHLRLHHYGYYVALLSGLPRIGVIGPRDLTSVLPERLGVGEVEWLPVPPEMKHSNLEAAEKDTLIQADTHRTIRFHEIVEHELPQLLARHPGLVVLVGAGILGKMYCGKIKALGGIAIDVGSAMDLWAGLQTRTNKHFDGLLQVAR